MSRRRRVAPVVLGLWCSIAGAQQASRGGTSAAQPELGQGSGDEPAAGEVVVTGTRFGGRTVTASPVPVDTLSGDELRRPGYTQLNDQLRVQLPSFNIPRPSTAGAVDFYSAPSLRGLSPGQLLVLVNGKRRHPTGDLSNHNQLGRGDVAYDLNAIPAAAIGRLEVLRDGAAAQYGADAIAGVVNLVLDSSVGTGGTATLGITERGDGQVADLSAWHGVRLGDGGFLRVTAAYRTTDGTNRAEPDTRQQYFGRDAAGRPTAISGNHGSGTGLTPSNGALDPREATVDRRLFQLGEPRTEQASAFANAALPLGAAELYGFGGASRLHGTSVGFSRRAGQDETVRAIHPDGYAPDIDARLDNYSVAIGVRGTGPAGFGWDLSTLWGGSRIDLDQSNSNNASLGPTGPTESYRGGIRFDQWTSNLDLTREVDAGLASPLSVALGAEYREEHYRLVAGDLASYVNGGSPVLDGPNAGRPAPVGFQPTAGTRPSDARNERRRSVAIYGELEQTLGPVLVSGAVRHEHFSDFGDTTNWKLAARYEPVRGVAFRGSYSTGFRAPNLAQSFFSTTSNSIINGQLTSLRLLPVDDPAARVLGATDLRPERSRNLSVGLTAEAPRFTATVDLYRIAVDDRIALSSTFQDARVTALLARAGLPGIAAASYLTNAVDTTTRGFDAAVRYVLPDGGGGRVVATLAANHNATGFRRIAPTPAPLAALGIATPLFDLTQRLRFTDGQPRDKVVASLRWERGRVAANLSAVRYGAVRAVQFTALTPARIAVLTPGYDVELRPTDPASGSAQVIQRFGAETIADLGLDWRASDRLTLAAGVSNVLNTYPDRNIASTAAGVVAGTNGADNVGIFPYNYQSPFGFNGRGYFVRAGFRY